MIRVTTEDQDSVVTSEEVVGESTPAMPEDVKYTTGPDMIWPPNVTPQVKESHPEDTRTNLGSPSPSVQSSNLVNSTINSPIIPVISPHSSPTS
jgi:hypothetical protein